MLTDRKVHDVRPGVEVMDRIAREWRDAIEALFRNHGLILSEGVEDGHATAYYISDERYKWGLDQVDLSKRYYAKLRRKGNVYGRNHYEIIKGEDELKGKGQKCALITGIRALILMESEPYLEVGEREDWVVNSIASSQISPGDHVLAIYTKLLTGR